MPSKLHTTRACAARARPKPKWFNASRGSTRIGGDRLVRWARPTRAYAREVQPYGTVAFAKARRPEARRSDARAQRRFEPRQARRDVVVADGADAQAEPALVARNA